MSKMLSPSTLHQELLETVPWHIAEQFQPYFRIRVQGSCVTIRAIDGNVTLLMRQGGQQGGVDAPILFMHTYYRIAEHGSLS